MKDTSALEKAEEVEEEGGEQQQAMHRDKHRTNGLNATAQCRNVRKGKASLKYVKRGDRGNIRVKTEKDRKEIDRKDREKEEWCKKEE